MRARPLPSPTVVLSVGCWRYCGPLRLPGQPGGDFGGCLIRPGWPPVGHWPGSPVVPSEAVPACHPCYPGGPQMTRQRRWSPKHRSSSPDNGVDALTEVNEATPGFAARYGLRGCARPCGRARQGTRCLGLPLAPPSNYPGALPAPGAGLPPASSRVSTAYCPVPFVGSSPKPVSGQEFLCRPAGIGPGFRTGSDQGGYHYRRWRGGIR